MTAEIVVMNKIGVALAADSAVTVRTTGAAIPSAEKLFQLSAGIPVGVLAYNSAEVAGQHIEVLIKEFRMAVGAPRDHLQEYIDHLVSFIETSTLLFPPDVRAKSELEVLDLAFQTFCSKSDAFLAGLPNRLGRTATRRDIEQVIRNTAGAAARSSKKYARLSGLSLKDSDLLDKHKDHLEKLVSNLSGRYRLSKPTVFNIKKFIVRSAASINDLGGRTGIVFAGFGKQDPFPGCRELHIEGFVDGKLRWTPDRHQVIDRTNNAVVMPFAQRDVVTLFLEGIASDVEQTMFQSTKGLVSTILKKTLKQLGEGGLAITAEMEKAILLASGESTTRLRNEWQKAREAQWRPVVEVLASLPKEDLAVTAEALVDLTRFRRRATLDATVGGPIDVAVVTRGDGFIWTKRKHYFDPRLNPRFFTKLISEGAK